MARHRALSGIGAGLLLVLLGAVVSAAEELNEESYARWRDHVLPRPEEVAYQGIPWRPTLWQAVVEAQRQEKPILFWTMNGHPLGCT